MNKLPIYPFDPQRCIGSVLDVTPTSLKVNLPNAATPEGYCLYGNRMGAGEVGEFVFIECGDFAVFGRIVSVKLFEKERLTVEPEYRMSMEPHPLGNIQVLASINLNNGRVDRGLTRYPRLGCKAYSSHPLLTSWIAEKGARINGSGDPLHLNIAYLPECEDTAVRLLPEHVFGRHCAILGSTGGGKSWTIARLLEEVTKYKSKVILLDPTGEFYTFDKEIHHVHFGTDLDNNCDSKEVVFPYTSLTEGDLFAIFTPSGQTQVPKLRAAMKSLKLARLEPDLATDGVIIKAKREKREYEELYRKHINIIESPSADFDIYKLTRQIDEECVYINDFENPGNWGKRNENERSYCVSLISRIEDVLSAPELSCIFRIDGKRSILEEIEDFLSSSDKSVLRISLKYVSFAYNAREVLANALGRYLLSKARDGCFLEKPLLIFVDEAHNFLDKSLGDENNKYALDAFSLIAKEGRKFSLSICISTQRPRDIPQGVLSQIGTLLVHRLTNENDKEVVESACGDIDKSILSFLPSLVPGEALIVGVDFPIPVAIKINKPTYEPDSKGPRFQEFWR